MPRVPGWEGTVVGQCLECRAEKGQECHGIIYPVIISVCQVLSVLKKSGFISPLLLRDKILLTLVVLFILIPIQVSKPRGYKKDITSPLQFGIGTNPSYLFYPSF